MKYTIAFLMLLCSFVRAGAQKPFTEGIISYAVVLQSAEGKQLKGEYSFTIKGAEIKKELKLDNGYHDIILMNCNTNDVYSLQTKDGRKYAIQLSMSDLIKKQDKYVGFTVGNEQANSRHIAGLAAYKGRVTYRDGSVSVIYYTKDWNPSQPVTYERFPAAKFLPLSFSYKDENGMSLQFDAEKVEAGPVENGTFRIPADYKMISYKEYKEMRQ